MNPEKAMNKVMIEYARASQLYPPFNSAHEGYAVIVEELDELWAEIKKLKDSNPHNDKIEKEAVQLAAVVLRFLTDCVLGM